MPRRNKFQPRQDHKKELARLAKNFNAKLSRIEKKHPENMEYMPDRVKVSELWKNVETYQDFQKISGRLRRFTKQGVEEVVTGKSGATTSKYLRDEYKRDHARENQQKLKRIEKDQTRPETKGGIPTGQTKAQMKSKEEVRNLVDTKTFDDMKPNEFKDRQKLFAARALDSYDRDAARRMQQNYIKGLIREGYSEKLQHLISRVPSEKFVEIVETDVFASFDFIYDEQQLLAKQEQLFSVWEQYAEKTNQMGVSVISIQRIVEFENLEQFIHVGFRDNHRRK